MRFKVANYSRLEIRLDTLHIYTGRLLLLSKVKQQQQFGGRVRVLRGGRKTAVWTIILVFISQTLHRKTDITRDLEHVNDPCSGIRLSAAESENV